MANKHIALVSLAVILTAVALSSSEAYSFSVDYERAASNKPHNLIMGSRQPGDRLVHQEKIYKPSKWLQIVEVTKNYNFINQTITQVRALDQKTNGKGALPARVGGGPGYGNISIKFKSQRSESIEFLVEIYTKLRKL